MVLRTKQVRLPDGSMGCCAYDSERGISVTDAYNNMAITKAIDALAKLEASEQREKQARQKTEREAERKAEARRAQYPEWLRPFIGAHIDRAGRWHFAKQHGRKRVPQFERADKRAGRLLRDKGFTEPPLAVYLREEENAWERQAPDAKAAAREAMILAEVRRLHAAGVPASGITARLADFFGLGKRHIERIRKGAAERVARKLLSDGATENWTAQVLQRDLGLSLKQAARIIKTTFGGAKK